MQTFPNSIHSGNLKNRSHIIRIRISQDDKLFFFSLALLESDFYFKVFLIQFSKFKVVTTP